MPSMKETTRLCPFETSGSGLPGPFFLAIRVSRTQGVHLPDGLPMGSALGNPQLALRSIAQSNHPL